MDAGRLLTLAACAALAATPAWGAHHRAGRSKTGLAEAAPGRAAVAAALQTSTERAVASRFQGGMQVFAYTPGRIYEVWTAPLRVTGLTLGAGETIVAMAAGDTVEWQIGQTTSGEGPTQRSHVLIKPLREGLSTNLVLTTNRRLYVVALRSGSSQAFNTLVAWTPEPPPAASEPAPVTQALADPAPSVAADPALFDARYRIVTKGRRPAWTPSAAMTDGRRTLIVFPSTLAGGEAPALFAIGPDGAAQMVNYRQKAGLIVVDRVLDRAELRLGSPHPQIVTLVRDPGATP